MLERSEARLDDGGELSFDLTNRPWVLVQRPDGTEEEISLGEVFDRAGGLRRLSGDLPTQEFALLRLLLAVAHDALEGPRDTEHWAELWADKNCFEPVGAYLDAHRDRFDLLHPTKPFLQVADLRTTRDEVFSLNRIVADVPNGEPFFSSRMPTVSRLGFAEAARWVVHTHAYDTSGIKTGIDGDNRIKGGKVYPLGVGWAGTLGGVFAEGRNLRETLLLNLIALDFDGLRFEGDDLPAWRREAYGPGASGRDGPTGLRDLYTWQTRRLRLHCDVSGAYGVVLGYGDPLAPHNMHGQEPMTAWRRSPAQEKKRGEGLVYLPREHNPTRSAWRGLNALVANPVIVSQGAEPASLLRPPVFEWIAGLVTYGELPRGFQIRARVIGPVYGTQQSVIEEIVDDHLDMAVVLLHRQDREYAQQAVDAVAEADAAVSVLGDLARDLARASGGEADPPQNTARDVGFAALDGPFRIWLRDLAEVEDPYEHRTNWQRDVYQSMRRLADRLLTGAGDTAWEGRVVATKKGTTWLNSALAEKWFLYRLGQALGHPLQPDRPVPDAPDSDDSELGPDSSAKVPAT